MTLPDKNHPIAYFCAEFGIDNDLPTYAGGLGILAGDTLNAAADNNFPMAGVGVLYKGRSFLQYISADGKEEKRDSEFDHDSSFLRPTTLKGKVIQIPIPYQGSKVFAKIYQIRLGESTTSYFLSTDVDGNPPEWINDMDALYNGDTQSILRQMVLLGIGGVRLLNQLGINPSYYHLNEGRPGFSIWEIAKNISENEGVNFETAWGKAKEKIIYTNHTLVSAGNLSFPKDLVYGCAKTFVSEWQIDVDPQILINDGVNGNTFDSTLFALNTSSKQTAVSKVHEKYAKKQWPKFNWISITNGIHLPRWQDSDFRNPTLSDSQLWEMHMVKKQELASTVVKRTGFGFDPNSLVISWARRLAEYKQPRSIFEDISRLKPILSNVNQPVQLLFAGNSHSADPNSKSIIETIIKLFSTELNGHAIFVPNYNISLANHLTSGSDVWLNTPKGNLEACGTSGMKAISNGVLNCTVIDGWTYEVDWTGLGWTIDPKNVAGNFYEILEKEIAPLYYERNKNSIPVKWVERMRKSIELANKFSANRMLAEYKEKLYKD